MYIIFIFHYFGILYNFSPIQEKIFIFVITFCCRCCYCGKQENRQRREKKEDTIYDSKKLLIQVYIIALLKYMTVCLLSFKH